MKTLIALTLFALVHPAAAAPLSRQAQERYYSSYLSACFRTRGEGKIIWIPSSCFVRNNTGCCAYAAVATCALFQRIAKLYDFAEGKGASWPAKMARDLKRVGYTKFVQVQGSKSKGWGLLKRSIDDGKPCLFSIPGHALVCCGYNASHVWVIDNTGREALKIKGWPLAEWKRRHDGWVLVLNECRPWVPQPRPGPGPKPAPHIDPPDELKPEPEPKPVTPMVQPVDLGPVLKKLGELEAKIAAIKPGKDGLPGPAGRDGKPGLDGKPGKDGKDGDSADSGALQVQIDALKLEISKLKSQLGTNKRVIVVPAGK